MTIHVPHDILKSSFDSPAMQTYVDRNAEEDVGRWHTLGRYLRLLAVALNVRCVALQMIRRVASCWTSPRLVASKLSRCLEAIDRELRGVSDTLTTAEMCDL